MIRDAVGAFLFNVSGRSDRIANHVLPFFQAV